jgi:hypothetical protein
VKPLLLGFAAAGVVLLVAVAGSGEDRTRQPAATPGGRPEPRVSAPARPAPYRVPRRSVAVSSSKALHRALAARARTSIVLAPGTYRSRRPFLNPHGHQIYSARLGQAVLRAGLSLGGNEGPGGALVRGVVVDIADPRRTVDDAAIAVWGTGRRSRILDTTLRGHGVVPAGVEARRPDGLVVRRVDVRRFTDFGVLADANDLRRGELRNSASVRRVRARSCAWTGVWTGTATHGAAFDQIDVDRSPTGVYLEHFTHDSTFRRLRVGPRVKIGLTAEWADPAWSHRPASVGNLIEDSRFESTVAGVYLDEGTTRTTVRDSTFLNQRWGAIGDYRGNGNAAYGNDYDGIGPGAVAVRHDHLSTFQEG